ncbi:MAG: sensor histidine kinase [Gemmataceae bacterium]
MRWSVRYQILGPLFLLLLGLVGVCAWTAQDSARSARRHITAQVTGNIHTLSEATFSLNPHVLDMMKGLSGAEYVLIEPSGRRVATVAGELPELPTAVPPAQALADATLGSRVQVGGHAYFARGVALRPPHPDSGSTLYILYPESLLNDAIWQAVRPTLVLGATVGLAALGLTLVAAQRLVSRVRDLERRTRQIAAGEFSPMPLPRRDDELRDLAQSVNDMAARLAQLQDAVSRSERARLLGQLSGGLAHQLRNAVTGAKLAVQLHAQSCAGGDGEALEVAERQLSRMSADLQRFLDIGRDGGKRVACSLPALISDAVSLLRPQCRHAHIDLRWQPPEKELWTTGDAGQLGHLVLNVVSNAVEAAGPGGSVEVQLGRDGSTAKLEVRDNGPGPAPEIAARLFDPFVTGKDEGIGLGLAVAKQVADAHGGRIAWRRDDGRTVFEVRLPTS